jgi:hypothetical protein
MSISRADTQPSAEQGKAKLTLPLGFASPFAPNRSVSADSTAFLISRGFTQRNPGVFLSTVMAAPMPVQPETAGELTYSETAFERASWVILNPLGVMHWDESYEWTSAQTDQHHIHDQTERRPRAADVSRGT